MGFTRRALSDFWSRRLIERIYFALIAIALLWAMANCVYVYLVWDGTRGYRIETAVWLLALMLLPVAVSGKHIERFPSLSLTQQRTIAGVAIALWLLTFLPLLNLPFLSDDYVFLDLYRQFTDIIVAPQFFRPLYAAVFWALRRVGDGSPLPFHIMSLLLHGVSAALVYGCARRLFDSATAALVCFVSFLLNPLQLEATLWPSGLQELLWTTAILAALRSYIGERVLSVPRLALTIGFVCCGLLSKETAICFILLLPAADLVFYRLQRGSLLPIAYGTFAATCAGYFWLRGQFATMEAGLLFVPSRFFLKQFLSTPYKFFVQPWNGVAINVPVLIPCLVSLFVLALLFIRIVVQGASPRVLIGPVVIVIATLPVYSYFFVGADLIAARYIYFASIGWALLLAQLLGTIRSRALFAAAATGVALWSAVWLNLNLRPWRVAGDVVTAMRAGLKRGEPADRTIADWEAMHATKLQLKNGAPYQHQGVGIFINGYDQFKRITLEP
jgi:hypothetical protein